MFFYRFVERGKDKILAACDQDLMGKTISNGSLSLEIRHEFYGSNLCKKEKLLQLSKKATIINVIGRRCVSTLTKIGLIDKKNVLLISGVPHAQLIRI
jgi:hypothetical protein